MKLNVKKLDATIAKLQALRRLATDPDLSDFIEITGTRPPANGTAPKGASLAEAAGVTPNGHGVLRTNVLAICTSFADRSESFTVDDVYAAMQAAGTADSGTEKSVGNMLRQLSKEGAIQIAIQGKGRRATSYKV